MPEFCAPFLPSPMNQDSFFQNFVSIYIIGPLKCSACHKISPDPFSNPSGKVPLKSLFPHGDFIFPHLSPVFPIYVGKTGDKSFLFLPLFLIHPETPFKNGDIFPCLFPWIS